MSSKVSFIAFVSILLLVTVNILFIDIVLFSKQNQSEAITATNQSELPLSSGDNRCGKECQENIKKEISKTLQSSQPSVTPINQMDQVVSSAKEFYIPLGSGSTKSKEYELLNGVEAYINTSNYPQIKKATFEVYMHLYTASGRMFVRLYNVSDKRDVWPSEVSTESDIVSRYEIPITLTPGNKLYRVKIKSSIQALAYLDNARIKIVTY